MVDFENLHASFEHIKAVCTRVEPRAEDDQLFEAGVNARLQIIVNVTVPVLPGTPEHPGPGALHSR